MHVLKNLIFHQVPLKFVELQYVNHYNKEIMEQLIKSINQLLLELVMRMIYLQIKTKETNIYSRIDIVFFCLCSILSSCINIALSRYLSTSIIIDIFDKKKKSLFIVVVFFII